LPVPSWLFFLWGIAKEDYYDDDDVPRVISEMNLDAWINDKKDLDQLAEIA
jgi:hypothetical protein